MMARMRRLERPEMAIKPRIERSQRTIRARATWRKGDFKLVMAQRTTMRIISSKAEMGRPLMVKTVKLGMLSQGMEM